MVETPSRDLPDTEKLAPDALLLTRRGVRNEQAYRDWCVETNGMVEIGEESFHPADVLDAMSADAARRGRDDVAAQVQREIEQTVCERFPAPIAIPFQAFVEGPRAANVRLQRLRDTWESLVRVLASIALAEAVSSDQLFAPLPLRDGADQGWRACKRRDLFSDKLSVRIGLIEGVLHRAQELGVPLRLAAIVPQDILAEIRRLNVVRNGFSHGAAMSEVQAQKLIDEIYPAVVDLLLDLRGLEEVEFVRVCSVRPGNKADVEKLTGHAQSQRIGELALDQRTGMVVAAAERVEGFDRVLVRLGNALLDLSPFVYAADDETGHRTRVFQFKSKSAECWSLECVADATTQSSPCALHEAQLVRFEARLLNTGDGT